MKLYGFFRSSAAFRVPLPLNLKSLDYEQASIHLRNNQQSAPDYLKLNPQALVPTLADDGNLVLSRSLAQGLACDTHPIDNLRVLRYLADPLGHDEKTVESWFNHWIKLGFDAIE